METAPVIVPAGPEAEASTFAGSSRPNALVGRRLAILDNGKPNAAHVVRILGRAVADDRRVAEILEVTKPVASRPIDDEALIGFKGFDAAIVGVGD